MTMRILEDLPPPPPAVRAPEQSPIGKRAPLAGFDDKKRRPLTMAAQLADANLGWLDSEWHIAGIGCAFFIVTALVLVGLYA